MARFKHTDKALFQGKEVEILSVSTNHRSRITKYTLTTGEKVLDSDLKPIPKEVPKTKKESKKNKSLRPVEEVDQAKPNTSDNQEDTKN